MLTGQGRCQDFLHPLAGCAPAFICEDNFESLSRVNEPHLMALSKFMVKLG